MKHLVVKIKGVVMKIKKLLGYLILVLCLSPMWIYAYLTNTLFELSLIMLGGLFISALIVVSLWLIWDD